jgi:CRISPR-associated protein Cmr2
MKAVLDKGGSIAFPDVNSDKLLEAIRFQQGTPEIGSIPNRFKALVPDDFDGNACKQAVLAAWQRVADAVWNNYVAQVAHDGHDVKAIWDRQVENFWDMAWVIGDEGQNDSAWLDQRKNWRTYQPSHEGGDHCTLMGDWQELSGFIRAQDSKKQDGFWNKVRNQLESKLDLGDTERLCAIALIKRLYPTVATEAIGWKLNVRSWPSTSYMAAVPWIREAQVKADMELRQRYVTLVQDHIKEANRGETRTDLKHIEREPFSQLDGQLYYKYAIASDKERTYIPDEATAKEALQNHLKKLNDAVSYAASPFYALLLMDGDSLGKLLQNTDGNRVSQALATFTDGVDGIVREHCGKTVYAGGDDVLALLPLDQALDAAQKLREHYLKAFEQHGLKEASTISAAVIFAHYSQSFRVVLNEAHYQLDDIAKEQNGRDSIAVSVLTGSGRTVQWVSSWNEETSSKLITDLLCELAKKFESDYSSGFFYNIRERFELLTDESRQLIKGLEPLQLLTAEYQKNREKKAEFKDAEERVGNLLRVCRTRKQGKEDLRSLHIDGALLVRFLAGKGKGMDA